VIITDMARGDWEGFDPSKLGVTATETPVTFLRLGGPRRDPNFTVKSVRLAEGETVVGVPVRLEVTVSNLSDQAGSTLAQLFLSGVKADQKSIDLKAGEDGKVYFEMSLNKPGWTDGEVRLSGDRLASDDVFFFPLKVKEKVRVLVVDGDPRTALRNSESYYLVNALHPGGSEGSPFLTKVITETELGTLDLKPYEALFLLNVARPPTSKLSSFLELGKPVFLFLGDRIVPEEYNGIPLFPWRIRDVKESDGQKGLRIAQVDEKRDALKPFAGSGETPGRHSLRSASLRRYFKVERTRTSLLTLDNGDPLLLQADLGKGVLFLYASSADMDWNDLPLKAAYLPLIQGLVKEAVGLSRDSIPTSIRFGEAFAEKASSLQVAGLPGGAGIYRVQTPSGEIRKGLNPPFEESDLSKMSDGEIEKRLGTKQVRVIDYREELLSGFHASRKELWPFLLVLLFVVLGLELVIANGFPGGKTSSAGKKQE